MAKLTPWTLPESYYGQTWEGYLIAPVGRNRDSDLLTESNWQAQLKTLEAIPYGNKNWGFEAAPWEIVRENHWACGWIEWVAIHPSAATWIAEMEKLAARLEQYPALDEDDWSEREWESGAEAWAQMSVRERVEVLRKLRYKGSVLVARRASVPHNEHTDRMSESIETYLASHNS